MLAMCINPMPLIDLTGGNASVRPAASLEVFRHGAGGRRIIHGANVAIVEEAPQFNPVGDFVPAPTSA